MTLALLHFPDSLLLDNPKRNYHFITNIPFSLQAIPPSYDKVVKLLILFPENLTSILSSGAGWIFITVEVEADAAADSADLHICKTEWPDLLLTILFTIMLLAVWLDLLETIKKCYRQCDQICTFIASS